MEKLTQNDVLNEASDGTADDLETQIMARNASIQNLLGANVTAADNPQGGETSIEEIKQKVTEVERREAEVEEILSSLKEIFNALKKREEALNKREAQLIKEYDQIKEIEAMMKETDLLADSLNGALPGLGDGVTKASDSRKIGE